MIPVNFKGSNRILHRPKNMREEDCRSLPVHDTGREFYSKWEPTPEERLAIANGSDIWLIILGRGHPPVAITVRDPFGET